MREIGALEAKDQFCQLLNDVERGEEVIITRQGREEIARLVPAAKRTIDKVAARAAVQRIRARAEQKNLGPFDWLEWKAFRDDGRHQFAPVVSLGLDRSATLAWIYDDKMAAKTNRLN